MSYFTSFIEANELTWITEPDQICEYFLKEANISINLNCYDSNEVEALEDRARQRTDWIAEFNRQQQQEEEKRQMQAASEKMRQLDEKNDNGELSDGSDQEPELESMQVSERMDGLAEYEHHLPLHRIRYKFFIETLKVINASSNY